MRNGALSVHLQGPLTVANSIQFGINGEVVSTDGQILNRALNPNNVVHDSQRHNVGITTNTSDFASFNTGAGAASQGSSTTRVQLHQPTGLVKVAGFDVRPEVAETLAQAAPELFEAPEAKAAEAAKAADEARSEEITREDLNRHGVEEIEGYHQHLVGEVSTQNLIGLMVAGHRGEAPSEVLLNRIADEMHEPLDSAISKINAVSAGVQTQFTILARSMGLNADAAADWIKSHRGDTAVAAAQAHFMRRDLRAWEPLLRDYRAATGDGVRR
jgi:hypothetical protein